MTIISHTGVKEKFASYPTDIAQHLLSIRQTIFDIANQENLGSVEETLKWGEPSYLTPQGSTIRIDWKSKDPDYYGIYFHCQTVLVATFREIYHDKFTFSGNRALLFHRKDHLPMPELKHCLSLAMQYHQLKHLPLLGA